MADNVIAARTATFAEIGKMWKAADSNAAQSEKTMVSIVALVVGRMADGVFSRNAKDMAELAQQVYGERKLANETERSAAAQASKIAAGLKVGCLWPADGVRILEDAAATVQGNYNDFVTLNRRVVKTFGKAKTAPNKAALVKLWSEEPVAREKNDADKCEALVESVAKFCEEQGFPEALAAAWQSIKAYRGKLGKTSRELADEAKLSERDAKMLAKVAKRGKAQAEATA